MNSTMRPIFNESFVEKRGMWVSWDPLKSIEMCFSIKKKIKNKNKKNKKKNVEMQMYCVSAVPKQYLICQKIQQLIK